MTEKAQQFIIFLGDVALLFLSLYLALTIRHQAIVTAEIWAEHWPTFTWTFLIWIGVLYISGVYTISNIRNDIKAFVAATQIIGINFLLAITFFYVFPAVQLTPKTILGITTIIFFFLFLAWRRLVYRFTSKTMVKNVLMIGSNNTVTELQHILDHNPQYGYRLAAVLTHDARDGIGNLPDYQDQKQLDTVLKKHDISLIVLDNESRNSNKLVTNLYQHLNERLEFVSLTDFYESITKRISLDTIDQFWFLENLQEGEKRFYDALKRLVDIVFAVCFGAIALALLPFLALLIVISYSGPVFFTQIRLGKNGKPFRAIKLRPMVPDAEKHGPQWAAKNDPRVTPLGRWLRKLRLDEIPQLVNIFRGEMSFVGPRPERPEFVKTLEQEIPFYRERLLVKPGLTGWAQINYKYGATTKETIKKLQYDLYYVKNRSLVLDLGIILKTIKTVLSGAGQ